MLAPLILPVVALLGGAMYAAQLAPKQYVLREGRTYRFTVSMRPPRELTPADWTALLAALQAGGARDVLLTKGDPIVGIYTQSVTVSHTVEIGKWLEFESPVGLFSFRVDDVQDLGATA